ncbi:MAG TPA: 2-oxoacid:acceptor oxidoreductase family protein [Candidatus Hydrogenedentes bacterium]|nr:2-oxoacid:acceptor oxidoreductase family protein [Candidatus Hydrogenedentota bacterium]MDY0032059.1 2-oxoacid:acceptor oxidoreductase family protein [FCB group bacterium]NLT62592.1 pyruvate ferredoxin oxidoreductase [Candidatus Hydrogenedentota bacterium]HNV22989.1 2-oxoacid:acceptor oxidoreductase family protein [Candidatus Hydrogenedentota bacterium]HNZ17552.1 2-oxoacid:acceptor oxidoreductase family protein [Candidatus Hydrogenedentota bacterium]
MKPVTNVIIAGVGGQGVVKASDILTEAVFRAGFDVKKSEIHGMSQRGGSVASDIRFGEQVLSPMVPPGEADFILVMSEDEAQAVESQLKEGGTLLTPESLPGYIDEDADEDEDEETRLRLRCMNVALLGGLSTLLDIPDSCWREALCANLPKRAWEFNEKVFQLGRELVDK